MNVTLIGMAGAGKSFIGRELSKRAHLTFFDNDEALQKAHGKGIQDILDELGEELYLETEAATLVKSTRRKDNLVISPGGSIVYRDDAMDHLKDISTIVYLQVPFETVEARLKNAAPRAIIGLGKKTLHELYDERHPLYKVHADHTIDTSQRSFEEVISDITRMLPIDNPSSPDTL